MVAARFGYEGKGLYKVGGKVREKGEKSFPRERKYFGCWQGKLF